MGCICVTGAFLPWSFSGSLWKTVLCVCVSLVLFSHEGASRSLGKALCHWSLSPIKVIIGLCEKGKYVSLVTFLYVTYIYNCKKKSIYLYHRYLSWMKVLLGLWKRAVYVPLAPFSQKGSSRSLWKMTVCVSLVTFSHECFSRSLRKRAVCLSLALFSHEGAPRSLWKSEACMSLVNFLHSSHI